MAAGILTALLSFCACGAEKVPELPSPTVTPTPVEIGAEPTADAAVKHDCTLRINEVMASNKSTLVSTDGDFPDWIELYNYGTEEIKLDGISLSDGGEAQTLGGGSIDGGEYIVVFCEDDAFSLNADGDSLMLYDPDGNEIDSLTFGAAESDVSFIRAENGECESCDFPTPGFENSDAGYEAFQDTLEIPYLSINEAVSFDRTKPDLDGNCFDWVELKNNTEEAIELSDYYLSDNGSDRLRYKLPTKRLRPGDVFVIYCDSAGEAGFSLKGDRDQIYLSRSDGSLVDYLPLHDIPYGGSVGRADGKNGMFYFQKFTRGKPNTDGARLISEKPFTGDKDGVFNDVSSVTLELYAKGDIYYTLDGSVPSAESTPYTGTITIEKNTVVRAISIEEGKLPSITLDKSYIINEGHSLPVANIVVDPRDMNGPRGIYNHPIEDWECPATIAFFEDEDSFELRCGLKVHGATSRTAQDKKSYKLNFRDAFDGKLNYDLFENGVTEFSSVILRAAQESSFSTNMRDIVLHELAQQMSGALSTQDYKYCILYINGQYWGIYAFREAHSAEHYARHYGFDTKNVTMWHKSWDKYSAIEKDFQYVLNNDLKSDENFRTATAHLDIDALIDWAIIESWSGNFDINPPNVRYYYTADDEIVHYALVDLDLGLFELGRFDLAQETGYQYSYFIKRMCENENFRALYLQRLSEYLHGPLSKENFVKVVDGLKAELSPEIERDAALWNYKYTDWERELDFYMYNMGAYFLSDESYNRYFAQTAADLFKLPKDDFEKLFGDL